MFDVKKIICGTSLLALCAVVAAGEFKIKSLDDLVDPGKIKPGAFKLERLGDGIVKVTPTDPGAKSVTLALKQKTPIDDDTAWFSIPVFPVGPVCMDTFKAVFRTPSALGENSLNSSTFSYTTSVWDAKQGRLIQYRGWHNLLSEWPLSRYHQDRRKGMGVSAIEFVLPKGLECFYFRAPKAYSGDMGAVELASSAGNRDFTVYGSMAPVVPYNYSPGNYACLLTLRNAYQKAPVYVARESFDYLDGKRADPQKALKGFQIPALPKGNYLCSLRYFDQDGHSLKKEEFAYRVYASPATEMPPIVGAAAGPGLYTTFTPDKDDFIFDAGGTLGGEVKLNGGPSGKQGRLHCELREYAHMTQDAPLNVYFAKDLALPPGVDTARLEIPVTDAAFPANRGVELSLRVTADDGKLLDEDKYVLGVRGKNNTFVPNPGQVLTWREALSRPVIGEGAHPPKYYPEGSLLDAIAGVKEAGVSDLLEIDCTWSGQTEPLPGFYSFAYIDSFLKALHQAGLKSIMQGSSIYPPDWFLFQEKNDKTHDGRFGGKDVFAANPGDHVKSCMLELAKRYAKEPAVGMWVFWGYYGEGFTSDWIYSWRNGGAKSMYGEGGKKLYLAFIKDKYHDVTALNAAYHSTYRRFEDVPLPLPPVGQEGVSKLRNPRPVYSLPYEDFKEAKAQYQRDFYERFVAHDFRAIVPQLIAMYYYCDAETEYMRSTPGFFKDAAGILQRNGGNEISGVWNKQYIHFRSYENTPTMSEDNAVYADTLDDWHSNIFNGARVGGLGVHFFNYEQRNIKPGKRTEPVIRLFRNLKKYAFAVLATTRPLPPKVAVYYNSYDNVHTSAAPADSMFRSGYLAEPVNDRFLDRLDKHYTVLVFDSGAQCLDAKSAAAIVSWVKSGGALILTPATAAWQNESLPVKAKDDYWFSAVRQPLSHGNYLLKELGIPLPETGRWAADLAGPIHAETTSSLYFSGVDELDFANAFSTYIFPKDSYPQAEVLARFTSPAKMSGNPAALSFSVGKGKVLLLSQYPEVSNTAFYHGVLSALDIPRYISFSNLGNPSWDSYKFMLGYVLEAKDGSWIIMAQHASDKADPHFVPEKISDKPPFKRQLHVHGLPDGDYEVFDIMDGKKNVGDYSGTALGASGFPAAFEYGELRVFQIMKR